MTGPSSGWPIIVEEATRNHWIGSSRGVAMVFAYQGSYADVRHVHVGARLVDRLSRSEHGPASLLFVLPSGHAKPPEPIVRSELSKAARKLDGQVARAAVVVLGTGFAAAIHRSAISGLLALLRTRIPVKVAGTVREGLGHLIDPGSEGFEELSVRCEALSIEPAPTSVVPSDRPRRPSSS